MTEPRVVSGLLLDGFTVDIDEGLLVEQTEDGKSTWTINATLASPTFFYPDDQVTARITLADGTVLVGGAYVVTVTENTFAIRGWWALNPAPK